MHAHFRCEVCLRIFDVSAPALDPAVFERAGHQVDRLDLRAEGICVDCQAYEAGLEAGKAVAVTVGASEHLHGPETDLAVVEIDSPVGRLLLAADEIGVVRLAFEDQGDVEFLRTLVGRGASPVVQGHLRRAVHELDAYFAGDLTTFDVPVSWDVVGYANALQATDTVPYGTVRSYHLLPTRENPDRLGFAFGVNPVPIIAPCHRVSRGATMPDVFVGGSERRTWLLDHERSHAERTPALPD